MNSADSGELFCSRRKLKKRSYPNGEEKNGLLFFCKSGGECENDFFGNGQEFFLPLLKSEIDDAKM